MVNLLKICTFLELSFVENILLLLHIRNINVILAPQHAKKKAPK